MTSFLLFLFLVQCIHNNDILQFQTNNTLVIDRRFQGLQESQMTKAIKLITNTKPSGGAAAPAARPPHPISCSAGYSPQFQVLKDFA